MITVRPPARARRAMSLTELIAATVVFMILILSGYATYHAFVARTAAGREQLALVQLSASAQQYQQSRGFFPGTPAELKALEPTFDYTTGTVTEPGDVSVHVAPGGTLLGFATLTEEGDCVTTTVLEFAAPDEPRRFAFKPAGPLICNGVAATTVTSGAGVRTW